MRWRRVAAVLLMTSAAGLAQMPDRKALTELLAKYKSNRREEEDDDE